MKVIIQMVHNATGEMREWIDTYTDFEEDNVIYHWEEGNYACDCNRRSFFNSHGELQIPIKDENLKSKNNCGSGEFSVRILSGKGLVIYGEL